LENQRGLSLIQIGTLGSIVGIGTVVFNFLLGMLEARKGFLIGQIGVAAYAFLLWRGTSFSWFAIAYFMLGGFRALRGLGVAQARPLVHESKWDWHMASLKPLAQRPHLSFRPLQVICIPLTHL
jgi:hypothetical protein